MTNGQASAASGGNLDPRAGNRNGLAGGWMSDQRTGTSNANPQNPNSPSNVIPQGSPDTFARGGACELLCRTSALLLVLTPTVVSVSRRLDPALCSRPPAIRPTLINAADRPPNQDLLIDSAVHHSPKSNNAFRLRGLPVPPVSRPRPMAFGLKELRLRLAIRRTTAIGRLTHRTQIKIPRPATTLVR